LICFCFATDISLPDGATYDAEVTDASERHDAVVIGAGPGGLAAAAMLGQSGREVLVLERDQVASSWRRHYERLHLHTWRLLSCLPGLRISARRGPWVAREGVVGYLENYVRHHGLTVRSGTAALRIDRAEADRGWHVLTSDGTLEAATVVVATGYNHTPELPDWPGRERFTGQLIHASQYRNASPYRGKDVLVAGTGNTGAELCVDLVEGGSARVWIAVRTPPHVALRSSGGVPAQLTAILMHRLPVAITDRLARVTRRLTIGDLTPYGLPTPQRGLFSTFREHDSVPILDVGLVKLIKERRVEPVAAVESFDGRRVNLADGAQLEPDAVIAATGYRRGLEPLVGHLGVLDPRSGRPLAMGGEEHPDAPGLHFVGYRNPMSGMFWEMSWEARRVARAA
jgi:putative flavoprotein involved in K+ transport